jgi:hypothetical protein
MKTIKIILLLIALASCESWNIPVEPYVITGSETISNGLFKYRYVSCEQPKRYNEFLSRKVYSVGDTIQFQAQ